MHFEGEQVAEFLAMQFKQDLSQQPEFRLGPAGLRRVQLQKLADLIGENFRKGVDGHTIGAKEMVPVVNEWLLAGRFDHLVKRQEVSGATPDQIAKMSQLERDNASLRDQVTDLARTVRDFMKARSAAEADAALGGIDEAAIREIADDPILSDPDIVGPLDHLQPAFEIRDEAELDALGVRDVRALARSLKIEVKGRDLDQMRLDIKVLYGMAKDANGRYAGVPVYDEDAEIEEATTDVENAA